MGTGSLERGMRDLVALVFGESIFVFVAGWDTDHAFFNPVRIKDFFVREKTHKIVTLDAIRKCQISLESLNISPQSQLRFPLM